MDLTRDMLKEALDRVFDYPWRRNLPPISTGDIATDLMAELAREWGDVLQAKSHQQLKELQTPCKS